MAMSKLNKSQSVEVISKWSKISEDLKLWHGFKIVGWKPYFKNNKLMMIPES